MTLKTLIIFAFSVILCTTGCKEIEKQETEKSVNQTIAIALEKEAILQTLNNETKAAFQRDYDAWKEHWVHVKTFIEAHPEPEPVPELLNKIDVRLYGTGAWVTYEQKDALRGLKRETRLMEKVNGEWKIAGMQTTIYGFETNETE